MTLHPTQHDEFTGEKAGGKAALRQRAEIEFAGRIANEATTLSAADTARLIYELQVHQIELEIQNEELRQAQVALAVSQSRYFNLYDLAPVGYVTLNGKGTIVEANLAAAELLGTTRHVVNRQPFTQFILADDQDIYYHFRKALLALNEPQTCELRMKHQNSVALWVRLDGTAVQEEKGSAPMCRLTMVDISERRRSEEERLQLQEQLAQAQKMEMVGRLAGGIAHDFNNMLAVILLRAELAMRYAGADTYLQKNLETIQSTAQHSAELVRQLLGFARKQTIAPQLLDLNAKIASLLPLLHQMIGEEIELIWQPSPNLWQIKMDPSQIDQILTNLCVNARDAIAGVGSITLGAKNVASTQAATEPDLAPGDYVLLTVSDTGSGINGDTLAHLFEPFFTTKEVGHGTGLGLATVDGIVQQNHGKITVATATATATGAGTTFGIYLPRFDEGPVAAEPDHAQPLSQGRGETILLVEDEEVVRQMAGEVLQVLGYHVLAAATPGRALALAEEQSVHFDLIMTDIVMPEMDGGALVQRIAALRPGIKVLYVSGYPADVVARRGVLEGGVNFLQKPFSLNVLATTVRKALEGD